MKRLIVASLACLALCACWNVKPVNTQAGAKFCTSDWGCPDGYSCRFPHVDSYAVCMQGGDTKWDAYQVPAAQ